MTFKEFKETDVFKSATETIVTVDGNIADALNLEHDELSVIGTGHWPDGTLLIDLAKDIKCGKDDAEIANQSKAVKSELIRTYILSVIIIILILIIMCMNIEVRDLKEQLEIYQFQDYVLEDCYECGSDNLKIRATYDEKSYIECKDCNLITDGYDSIIDLINDWNDK